MNAKEARDIMESEISQHPIIKRFMNEVHSCAMHGRDHFVFQPEIVDGMAKGFNSVETDYLESLGYWIQWNRKDACFSVSFRRPSRNAGILD
jgi:hypothetical protein